MLYQEFVEGTGCRDNDHNYKVYKDLEVLYMNSDISKAEIYEYGKKLVDNSKSEKELQVEKEIKEQIKEHKAEIESYKRWIEDNQRMANYWKEHGDKEMTAFYRNPVKTWKEQIRYHREQINALKWILSA